MAPGGFERFFELCDERGLRMPEHAAELRALAGAAAAALREAATSESAEVRKRAAGVLAEIGAAVPSPEEVRALRAVEVLAWADTPEARRLLAAWAGGAPGSRLTVAAEGALARTKR